MLNASNEVAVAAFMHHKLSFCGIMDVVERVVSDMSDASAARSLDDILSYDHEARIMTSKIIDSYSN